ncbi:MAG: hypothetical protein GY751_09305 [Bacteroidetes bacterium]|nr:hypothetical protein [Bacteroidota bacterium]
MPSELRIKNDLPVIDVSAFVSGTGDVQSIGREIHDAHVPHWDSFTLQGMTQGYYCSILHRDATFQEGIGYPGHLIMILVLKQPAEPLDLGEQHTVIDDRDTRLDKPSVHDFQGTYGDYILWEVALVCPELIASQKGPE